MRTLKEKIEEIFDGLEIDHPPGEGGWIDIFSKKNAIDEVLDIIKNECISYLKWAVREHSVPYEGFSLSGNRLLGGDTKFVNGEELTMSQFYTLYIQYKDKNDKYK